MNNDSRKKEIIDICLKTFMEKGLANTPTKDLCKALHMGTGGIFYWFETKDEIVLACVEEAKIRIERDLFGIALKDLDNPDKLAKDLYERAKKHRNLMKFFVTACSLPQYQKMVEPSLEGLSNRYKKYIEQFAERLCTTPEVVAPYVYIVINTMMSFMLFGVGNFTAPQLDIVYNALTELLKKRSSNLLKNTKTNL